MKILKYSLFLFFVLSVVSCDEDRFTAVKKIEFPEHTPVLAVTSHLGAPSSNPDNTLIPQAFISPSKGILDNNEFELIDDATVKLMKDGNLFYELEYQESDGNYYYYGPTMEITGGTYTLEVDAPGYDPVKATQTLPSKPEVVSATYDFETVPYDFYSDLYDLFKIKIQDDPDQENYYAFDVHFEVKNTTFNQVYLRHAYDIESDDPLFEGDDYNGQLGAILPDISFNGNSYDVRLLLQSRFITDTDEEIQAVIVDVKSVTKDYYIYERSIELSNDAQDNPFAEPVLVHTNMENGLGIFSLENSTRYRIEL